MTNWPTKPYSLAVRRQVPNLGDSSIVGAWPARPAAGVLPDLTGAGNDGVIDGAVMVNSVIGDAMQFVEGNQDDVVFGGANAFPLTDVTVEFWFFPIGQAVGCWMLNYRVSSSDAWGVRFNNSDQIVIYDDIDNAGASLYATTLPLNQWHHCVAVIDALENLIYIFS